MHPDPFAIMTSTAVLRAVKVLLQHDVAPAAVLAFIEDFEAQEAESKKIINEMPTVPRHIYQNA